MLRTARVTSELGVQGVWAEARDLEARSPLREIDVRAALGRIQFMPALLYMTPISFQVPGPTSRRVWTNAPQNEVREPPETGMGIENGRRRTSS